MRLISSIKAGAFFGFTVLFCSVALTLIVLAGCNSPATFPSNSSPASRWATVLAETTALPRSAPFHTSEPVATQVALTLETTSPTISMTTAPKSETRPASPVATGQITTAGSIAEIQKPDRDLVQLAIRYGFADKVQLPAATPMPARVGDEESFWVANQTNNTYFEVSARLVTKTRRASFWMASGPAIQNEQFERAAAEFEERIFDTIVEEFGFDDNHAIDDFHINILHANVPGVAGYYSSSDEYPTWVNRHSNQRKIIYINIAVMQPGTVSYYSVVAHELMHALQWMLDSSEATWVSEGTAELAADAAYGLPSGSSRSYLQRPSTQLTGWVDPNRGPVAAHYGAGYLFFRYLADALGGFEPIGDIIGQKSDGIAGIESYLLDAAIGVSFDDLFADWAVANYLRDTSISNGQYGYSLALSRPAVTPAARLGPSVEDKISPFAVHYLELTPVGTGLKIDFSADPEVKVVPLDAETQGWQWWSNRGDSINTRLTRTVDLTNVASATLKYRIWYDIEKDFDYGYLSVSTDDGQRWQTIGTPHTTRSNPNGQSYGDAYNGENDGQKVSWIDEIVDLTQFTGRTIQLRFEYVTDDAYVREGFGLEGIEIDALGWKDQIGDTEWQSEGFVRLVTNRLPTSHRIALIRLGDSPQVDWVNLDDQPRGTLVVDPNQSVLLVVINSTRLTNQPSGYRLNISPNN